MTSDEYDETKRREAEFRTKAEETAKKVLTVLDGLSFEEAGWVLNMAKSLIQRTTINGSSARPQPHI